MAFTDFKKISDVQEAYNIRYELRPALFQPQPFEPSASFIEEFEQLSLLTNIYASEQMRKQAVIWPMLTHVYRTHADHLTIWSEETISVPEDTKLSGAPDYFLAARSPLGISVLGKPSLVIVEAKQDNFTRGWGQCLAAMVAAQMLNQTSDIDIFGIVTNGQTWQFGRLPANLFEQADDSVSRIDAFGYINAFFAEANRLAEQQTAHTT